MTKNKDILNKDVTKAIHGIAILMMVYHHIFINGNTWFVENPKSFFDILNGINFGGAGTFQETVAWFCRICVSLFAFTSGYGIYAQLNNKIGDDFNLLKSYKYCLKRIWSFYKKYLIVFIIFIGLEYYTNSVSVEDFDIKYYLLSLLGLSTYYNDTWWYVSQYYLMVLASPLVYFALKKIKPKHYLIIAIVLVLSFVVAFATGNFVVYFKFYSKNIQTQLMMFLIIFIEGMFFNRYGVINYIGNRINKILSFVVVIAVFVLRTLLIRAPSDSMIDLVLICPYVIALAKLLEGRRNTILRFLGVNSTYIWFVHSYFYAYMFFDLVIMSDYSIIVYVQTVIYSLTTAIILTKFEGFLKKILEKPAKSH